MTHVDVSDFTRAAAKLRAAPARLRRHLEKRINEAARPAMRAVLVKGSRSMPQRGGLARHLAATGNAKLTRSGSGIVAILGKRGAYLAGPNSGLLRHPTFAHRDRWVSQSVPAGTYDAAFAAAGSEIGGTVAKALDDVSRSL